MQDTVHFQDFRENGNCIERTAEALRTYSPWVKWIAAIRAYGESPVPSLHGKNDALLLAQAMWDHGCSFGANLSAQNVLWGDCYSCLAAKLLAQAAAEVEMLMHSIDS